MHPVRRKFAPAALVAIVVVALEVAVAAGLPGAKPPRGLPPPTPVGPRASPSPSPFVTVLHTPVVATGVPRVSAPAAILADLDTGQVLFAKNAGQSRPIASVTKIMTALLVLRRRAPDDVVKVSPHAAAPLGSNGLSELGLAPGERITVGELTWALLLQSANDAALALAEDVAGSVGRFVARMNAEARRLGMQETRFSSPSGLDDRGYSSARDLVTLTRAAYAATPRFGRIVATRFHDVPSPKGPPRHIQNRNVLLWLYPGAIGVKTGYTSKAGFCVVAAAERDGRRLIAVVLGAPGEPFSDAAALLDYGFDAFAERALVVAGEPAGEVRIRGGTVPVVTGASLNALVPAGDAAKVTRTVEVDPTAAFPPAPGERVGSLRLSIPGRVVGQVPLVVSDVPPPPPYRGGGTWWRRAATAVAGALSGVVHALLG